MFDFSPEIEIFLINTFYFSNPDDNAQFSWPGGEKHIEKDLASEFGSKLNVGTSQISAPPDDSGPPAFEPGKPWPGSKHPNSEMMNPAKNRDLTPAEYNDMLRQTRANNVRHPVSILLFRTISYPILGLEQQKV